MWDNLCVRNLSIETSLFDCNLSALSLYHTNSPFSSSCGRGENLGQKYQICYMFRLISHRCISLLIGFEICFSA